MKNQLQERPNPLSDERFIAQLGLISIQARLEESSEQTRRWTSSFVVGDSHYHIEGFAADFGRPRGIDADTLLALEALFIKSGCPEDNTVRTTPYELLGMVSVNPSGKSYKRLKESLMRLWRVGFVVRKATTTPGPWKRHMSLNTTLQLLQGLTFMTDGGLEEEYEKHDMTDGNLIVRLSEPLAESIRQGFICDLDRALWRKLNQPVARALYRILQAHRPQQGPLSVNIMHFATLCGIFADTPTKIRRVLAPAHEELTTQGYLQGVQFLGSGSTQVIEYEFKPVVEAPANPELVALLVEMKVNYKRAEALAAKYPERVKTAVDYIKMQAANGKQHKSRAGAVVDIITNYENYTFAELVQSDDSRSSEERKLAQLRAEEAAADAEFQAKQQMLLLAPPEEQWASARPVLRLLVGNLLSADDWEKLERDCRSGQLHATKVSSDLSKLDPESKRVYLERHIS